MLRKGATLIAEGWLKADVFHATGATVAKVGSKNSARFVLACSRKARPSGPPTVATTRPAQSLVCTRLLPQGSPFGSTYGGYNSTFPRSRLYSLAPARLALRVHLRWLQLDLPKVSFVLACSRKARPSGPPTVATTRPSQGLVSAPWFSFSLFAFRFSLFAFLLPFPLLHFSFFIFHCAFPPSA
jgi:hypothetical protein